MVMLIAPSEVALVWQKPRRWWKPVRYRLSEELFIGDYTVPKGFETDGASIPWPIRGTLSPSGPWFPAAVLHDWLLTQDGFTRRQAAHEFRSALRLLKVSPWVAQLLYIGVRAWDRVQEW